MKPIVELHNKTWQQSYETESTLISDVLSLARIHHIGSTSIPGIYAKPIIDILGETDDLQLVEAKTPKLEDLGYEAMGEFGIPGRRYFRKDVEGARKFNLHVFEKGSDEAKRHLRFRDYLIEHQEKAREYSDLKRRLAIKSGGDMDLYIDGKDAFIKEIDKLATARFGRW